MSLFGPDRKSRFSRMLIYCLVGIGVTVLGILQLTASEMMAVTTPNSGTEAIRVLEDTIALLKWVGCGVVTGLVAAVGLLYRALEKANAQLRQDLLSGLSSREELMKQSLDAGSKKLEALSRLTERVEALGGQIQEVLEKAGQICPYFRKPNER